MPDPRLSDPNLSLQQAIDCIGMPFPGYYLVMATEAYLWFKNNNPAHDLLLLENPELYANAFWRMALYEQIKAPAGKFKQYWYIWNAGEGHVWWYCWVCRHTIIKVKRSHQSLNKKKKQQINDAINEHRDQHLAKIPFPIPSERQVELIL